MKALQGSSHLVVCNRLRCCLHLSFLTRVVQKKRKEREKERKEGKRKGEGKGGCGWSTVSLERATGETIVTGGAVFWRA